MSGSRNRKSACDTQPAARRLAAALSTPLSRSRDVIRERASVTFPGRRSKARSAFAVSVTGRPCASQEATRRSTIGPRKAPLPHAGSRALSSERFRSAVYPTRSRMRLTTQLRVKISAWVVSTPAAVSRSSSEKSSSASCLVARCREPSVGATLTATWPGSRKLGVASNMCSSIGARPSWHQTASRAAEQANRPTLPRSRVARRRSAAVSYTFVFDTKARVFDVRPLPSTQPHRLCCWERCRRGRCRHLRRAAGPRVDGRQDGPTGRTVEVVASRYRGQRMDSYRHRRH